MKLHRRTFLAGLAAAGVRLSAQAEASGSAKKGWGGDLGTAQALQSKWYYNWGPRGESAPGVEFVPMVKTHAQVNEKTLAEIKARGAKTLLCLNEPERKDQGNTTVEKALEIWPQLMATGLRLGSPAPSSDTGGMAWLEKFMEGVKRNKLRVDFIALHWYRSSNAEELKLWLDQIAKDHRRPIWVTEFNSMYSGGDRNRFAREAWKVLDRHAKVERYAYFNAPIGEAGSLFQNKDYRTLTELGEDYKKR